MSRQDADTIRELMLSYGDVTRAAAFIAAYNNGSLLVTPGAMFFSGGAATALTVQAQLSDRYPLLAPAYATKNVMFFGECMPVPPVAPGTGYITIDYISAVPTTFITAYMINSQTVLPTVLPRLWTSNFFSAAMGYNFTGLMIGY